MYTAKRIGQRHMLLWALAAITASGCADRNEGDASGKGEGVKLAAATQSAKPVEAALRWGQAVTAKVMRESMASLAVAEVGSNSGGLSPEDERTANSSYFDEWVYRGAAGDQLEIWVGSDDFDTYLMVLRGEDGGDMALLAEDDDGGGDLNSALTVRLHAGGTYSIIVTSYSPEELGEYRLVLRGQDSSDLTLPVLTAGSSIQSQLTASDPALPDGTHYRSWSYHGAAGEQLTVDMVSEEFDTYLIFGRGRFGSSFEGLAEDDDGGMDTNSRVSVELPEDGTYTIVANSYDVSVGAFELGAESEAPADQAEAYPGGGDPAERYALLVGIDDYPGTDSDLQGPRGDVGLMHDLLVSTYGFAEENIVTLFDQDATRNNITQAFSAHLGQAGPEGIAVFFYSGHGARLEENRGIGDPVDPEQNGVDEALVVWGNGDETNLILDDELGFMTNNLGTSRTLLVVDACFSGTASRGGPDMVSQPKLARPRDLKNLRYPRHIAGGARILPVGSEGSKGTGAIDRLWRPQSHMLLAASSENEVAWTAGLMPGWDEPVSVFTYYLYQAMADRGSTATFEDVRADLVEAIANRQREHDLPPQTPQVAGQASGEAIAVFLGRR